MSNLRICLLSITTALLFAGCTEAEVETPTPRTPAAAVRVAETAPTVEARVEAAAAVPSAEDQPMTERDEEITRTIRESIVGNHELSIGAQTTVVVVTRGTVVTLRGTVASAAERTTIDGYAHSPSDVSRVDNLLEVAN